MDELKWYENSSLESIRNIIKTNIQTVSMSFNAIGYYLKNVRDRNLHKEAGYSSILDFAQDEFGIDPSWANRWMNINDRFSVDGNSPILQDKYKDYKSSNLAEMLTLTDQQLEQVTLTTTRAEIREMKKPEVKKVAPAQVEEPIKATQLNKALAKEVAIFCLGYLWDELRLIVREKGLIDFSKILEDRMAGQNFISGETKMEFLKAYIRVPKKSETKKADYDYLLYSDISLQMHSEWNTVAILKLPEQTQVEASFGECAYDANYICDVSNPSELVQGSGKTCFSEDVEESTECCWSCPKHRNCEYECNSSLYRPVNEEPKNVTGTAEIVTEPNTNSNEECTNCSLKGNAEFGILECHPERGEHKCFTEELDEAEIIEADIIQGDADPEKYSIADIQQEIRDHTNNLDILRKDNTIAPIRYKIKMRLDAANALLDRLRVQVAEVEPEVVQPELPILKNNDQRKEFIDAYETWPVWINQTETGEKYYRYNLTDKVGIVVKVSRKHSWEHYKETKDYIYGAEQYYLLGVKSEWSQKGSKFVEDDSRTFYECNTNKSALTEYLKEFQKKGA